MGVDAGGVAHASVLVEVPFDLRSPDGAAPLRKSYLVALCAYVRAVDEAAARGRAVTRWTT